MKLAALVALVLAAACSASPDDYDELDDLDDLDAMDGKADGASDWTTLGTGVAYQQVNTGHAIVIAYGGYTARLSYSAAWASELVDAKLGAAEVGHIYAVRGPSDPAYSAREIANSKLRAHLATIDDGTAKIYVVAHSSGAYVAHELLGQLHGANGPLLARVSYANLDGGGSGLSSAIVSSLADVSFVYARDPNLSSGLSRNTSTMRALGTAYGRPAFEVRVPGTGCQNGAGWCLHDVVITHRPHNSTTFDLARDYTDFAGRAVTTEYLDQFIA